MTLPYAEVIGDPIAHSKSPLIHNFWLKKLALPYVYRATRVTAARGCGDSASTRCASAASTIRSTA